MKLELSELEKGWLQGLLQNPINAMYPSDERQIDAEFRENLFNRLYALDSITDKGEKDE